MRLRTLLGHIDEAEEAGDLLPGSPVFAVVRDEAHPLDSPEAWYAVSVVGLETAGDGLSLDLVADESAAATDISVASLRSRVTALPGSILEGQVLVRMSGAADDRPGASRSAAVVEAFADEHGLGLMIAFAGYEEWIASQT